MPVYSPAGFKRSSWFVKFFECLFAMIVLITIFSFFFELPAEQFHRYHQTLNTVIICVWVTTGTVLSVYWQRKENKQIVDSPRLHVHLQNLIRYCIAFGISVYGFAKILKTQFGHSFQRDDTLAGSLNGFNLTWHFFSYSYALSCIIGFLQIAGCALLLFRRTTLLGVVILLPVMLNIVLINIFYTIALGAFLNAVLFTAGLVFLLLQRWTDLKKIFLQATDGLPLIRPGLFGWVIKLVPVLAAFLFIRHFATAQNASSSIAGKWKVDLMIKGGDTVNGDAWMNDKRAWSNIYLEASGQMAVCANPYVFEEKFSEYGTYRYDSLHHNMQFALFSVKDTVNMDVRNDGVGKMEWRGILRNDTTEVFLSRASIVK